MTIEVASVSSWYREMKSPRNFTILMIVHSGDDLRLPLLVEQIELLAEKKKVDNRTAAM